jgi:pyruvate dehydrogenase E2 component (dihydrolipoamide acetyltransferase)
MPEVFMPRLSDTMQEGAIDSWRKQVGDQVRKGDVLAEIETDKALMELEAYEDGVLTEILVQAGQSVPIGAPIAVIGQGAQAHLGNGQGAEPTPVPQPSPPQPPSPSPEAPAAQQPDPSTLASENVERSAALPSFATATPQAQAEHAGPPALPPLGPPPASPLARSMARKHGVDLAGITGTGPGGRVLRTDIEAALTSRAQPAAPPPTTAAPRPASATPPSSATATMPSQAPAAPPSAPQPAAATTVAADDEVVPLSRVRRITAQRLAQSAQQAPHFHLTRTLEADALLTFRQQANADLDGTGIRISVTDLLLKACAHALARRPEVNSSWAGDKLLRHRRVNIGLAVALEDGLVVPVVHDADRKTLAEISREAHDLAERARAGRLTLDEITGATFTISNLGMYGIDRFTAVINPPDAAILAVGAARQGAVVRDGQLAVAATMTLTLGIDHRVLDGAAGALFLGELAELLEHPSRIVL